jgi:hypothetical protein
MRKARERKAKYVVMVSFPGCLPNDSVECDTIEDARQAAKNIANEFREHDEMLEANGMSDGKSVEIVTPLRDIRASDVEDFPLTYAVANTYYGRQVIEIGRLRE